MPARVAFDFDFDFGDAAAGGLRSPNGHYKGVHQANGRADWECSNAAMADSTDGHHHTRELLRDPL